MTIHSILPKIEGFQPIPNAVMIPFMETQSAALAFAFGLNYEFGKRTIKSMDNETFNSLTPEQIANISANHSSILLNKFIEQVPKVLPAQNQIFIQYVAIEKEKVKQNIALAKWVAENFPQLLIGGESSDSGSSIRDENPTTIGTTTPEGKTITGTTTSNGITTTHYSDGTTTTSGTSTGTSTTTTTQKTADQQAIQILHTDIIRLATLVNELSERRVKMIAQYTKGPETQSAYEPIVANIELEIKQLTATIEQHSSKEWALQENYKVKYGSYYQPT